jgi:hypothetical protein
VLLPVINGASTRAVAVDAGPSKDDSATPPVEATAGDEGTVSIGDGDWLADLDDETCIPAWAVVHTDGTDVGMHALVAGVFAKETLAIAIAARYSSTCAKFTPACETSCVVPPLTTTESRSLHVSTFMGTTLAENFCSCSRVTLVATFRACYLR